MMSSIICSGYVIGMFEYMLVMSSDGKRGVLGFLSDFEKFDGVFCVEGVW